jgi:hypothetical protein
MTDMRTKLAGVACTVLLVVAVAGASSVACGGGVQTTPEGDAGSDAADGASRSDAADGASRSDTGGPPTEAGTPDGSCRTTGDCPISMSAGMTYCAGPYDWTGCMPGCMPQVVCASDSQCDGGAVCRQSSQPIGCGQTQGSSYCSPPCQSDGDCPPTRSCSSGHCNPRSCSACPAYFSCTNGACVPKACTSDSDCPTGYCVNASCVGALGECTVMLGCG